MRYPRTRQAAMTSTTVLQRASNTSPAWPPLLANVGITRTIRPTSACATYRTFSNCTRNTSTAFPGMSPPAPSVP